jgi:glycerol-3-phosphate acyltransferase PlsY
MMGHVFPCFSRFRGGKGVAAAAGVIILTNLNSPFGLLLIGVLVFIFFTIVIGTKFVSLASVITMMIYPILQNMLNPLPFNVLMAALTALVIAVRHIDNLKRIHAGTESKISLKKTDKHKKDEPRDN